MSNQVLLWSLLILPWFTLLLMKKEDVKRYMPVGVFAALTVMLIDEISGTFNTMIVRETVFPLNHTLAFVLGFSPVLTIWLFKLYYERFWFFMFADTVINLGFSFLMVPWLNYRGIIESRVSGLFILLITTIHGILLYGYQMWQEDALVPAMKGIFSTKLQPVETKPFFNNKDNKDE